jgi:hypothetical protein
MGTTPGSYSEAGRVHYYRGFVSEADPPAYDIDALEAMQAQTELDWGEVFSDTTMGYAMAYYWPPKDSTVQVLLKTPISPALRAAAQAAFEEWGEKKGWKVELLPGASYE